MRNRSEVVVMYVTATMEAEDGTEMEQVTGAAAASDSVGKASDERTEAEIDEVGTSR